MALNLKKIAKLLTYSLGSFILLVVFLLLLLQTDMVKRYLLGLGVDKVNARLNGELTVGGISGSLFGDLELTDITIVRQQDTICGIQRIKLGYQLSPILDQQIMIDSVIIDSVTLSVRQYADSSWNLDGLMKPDSSVEADLTASDEPFGFTLLDANDVFEAFEAVRTEPPTQRRFAHELVTQHDMSLEQAATTAFGRQGAFVFDGLAHVVEEHARDRQVVVDLGVVRQQGEAGA